MEKEPDGLRLLQEHHVIQDGWIKLSPLLMKTLVIGEGDMISFIADEQGFRVKGSKKPPYFHASTEKPPTTLQTTPQPEGKPFSPPAPSPELMQMNLFEGGQAKPVTRRRKA